MDKVLLVAALVCSLYGIADYLGGTGLWLFPFTLVAGTVLLGMISPQVANAVATTIAISFFGYIGVALGFVWWSGKPVRNYCADVQIGDQYHEAVDPDKVDQLGVDLSTALQREGDRVYRNGSVYVRKHEAGYFLSSCVLTFKNNVVVKKELYGR